jgi:amino acid transporter
MTSGSSSDVTVVKPKLGLWALVMVIYFMTAGGAFGLEGLVGASGPGVALILILVTPFIWSLPTVLMVMELSTAIPVEGGYYAWVKRGLGSFWGFQEGWLSWLFSLVITAAFPVLFADYLNTLLIQTLNIHILEENQLVHWLVAVAVIAFFAWMNIKGAKSVGDSSTIFGVIVFAPFIVMIVIAIAKYIANPKPFWLPVTPPDTNVVGALGVGLFVVMWNYLGWDGISTVIDEVDNPKKNIPKAMLFAIPLVIIAYLFPVAAGLYGSSDWKGWEAGQFPNIAASVGGAWLGIWIAIAGLFSASGLFTTNMMSGSRVPFVLANDGYFPKLITRLHPTFGTPYVSILLCSVIYCAFATGGFQSLVVVSTILYGAALMLEFFALIALRIKEPRMKRPFKIPGGLVGVILITLLPAAVISLAIYSTYQAEGSSFIVSSLIALASGPVLYFVCKAVFKRAQPDVHVPIEYEDAQVA